MSPDASFWRIPPFEKVLWLGRRQDACLVIPVLNEGARLAALLERLVALGIPERVDVLVADGGSADGGLPSLEGRPEKGVRGLLRGTGGGGLSAQLRIAYAFALREGYAHILTIDGNGKDDPAAIPAFLKALEAGADFVQASRFLPGGVAENTPWLRILAIRGLHAPLLRLASGFPWTDTTQGFRGYSRRLLLDPRVAPFRDVFTTYELLAYLSYRAPRLGFRCVEVPTARRYPAKGPVPTKITGWRGPLTLLSILLRACLGRYNP